MQRDYPEAQIIYSGAHVDEQMITWSACVTCPLCVPILQLVRGQSPPLLQMEQENVALLVSEIMFYSHQELICMVL